MVEGWEKNVDCVELESTPLCFESRGEKSQIHLEFQVAILWCLNYEARKTCKISSSSDWTCLRSAGRVLVLDNLLGGDTSWTPEFATPMPRQPSGMQWCDWKITTSALPIPSVRICRKSSLNPCSAAVAWRKAVGIDVLCRAHGDQPVESITSNVSPQLINGATGKTIVCTLISFWNAEIKWNQ